MEREPAVLTVAEIVELKRSNMLYINPEYQRGAVWTPIQKKKLIDSLLRGYPLPLIYLHHIKTEVAGMQREDLEIIDGQQRINALFEFKEGAFTLLDPIVDAKVARFPKFIQDLPCPWGRRDFASLTENLQKKFLDTRLDVVMISTATDLEARDLFIRLQSGMPLNAQEKRDAWPGGFTGFVLKVGGKPTIARYPGHSFFTEMVGGQNAANRGKSRQLCAQMAMIFFENREGARWVDLKSQTVDDYYYENLDFDISAEPSQRFLWALDTLVALLGDGMRPKLKGHEAISLALLVDSLRDDYADSWRQRLATAFDRFVDRVNHDRHARYHPGNQEPTEFWSEYDVHTRLASADADIIKLRHTFFARKMYEFLSPLTLLDPRRMYGRLEREIIYYRDNKTCMFCNTEIKWKELEIHHTQGHALGGQTSLENGRAAHIACHHRGGNAMV